MIEFPGTPSKPTVYVVGAPAGAAAFLEVLPKWARRFDHRGTAIVPVAASPDVRAPEIERLIEFLRDEYHAVGAIFLAHAGAAFEHGRQLFDELDGDAELLGEIGVAVRAPATLRGLAPAKAAAWQAYDTVFGDAAMAPEALILGASAPARALALALASAPDGPQQVTLTTLDGRSMTSMLQRIADLPEERQPTLRHVESQIEHDRLVTLLPPGGLVVNAMGPASANQPAPVGPAALFPENGLVWDLDAIGISSPFLDRARPQRAVRNLQLADGPAFHQLQWLAAAAAVFGAAPTPAEAEKLRKLIG